MGIRIEWGNEEKTILLEIFEGKWTLTDYFHLIDAAAGYLATVNHTVHIIIDGRQAALPPQRMVRGIQYAAKKLPSNQGISVFVGVNLFIETLVNIGKAIAPAIKHVYFADNLDDAYKLIANKADTFRS